VIAKAQRILSDMQDRVTSSAQPEKANRESVQALQAMLPIFDPEPDPLRLEIEALDINSMTPIAVLNWVAERQKAGKDVGYGPTSNGDAKLP